MTTLHVRAHLPAVAPAAWVRPATLGIILGLALLLLRLNGVAAPDLTLPIAPFVVPGAPDLFATTA